MTFPEPRFATESDHMQFRPMWEEHLQEMLAFGGEVLATERGSEWGVEVFLDAILFDRGAAVIADEAGFVLWPTIQWNAPMVWGKAALGIATYVRPAYRKSGLSKAMRDLAAKKLKNDGFDFVIGSVAPTNKAGVVSAIRYGWKLKDMTMYLPLEDR